MRATKALVGAVLAAALVGALGAPLPAEATLSGPGSFHCRVRLPEFPSYGGIGTCSSHDLDSSFAPGQWQGLDDGRPSDLDRSTDPYVITGTGTFHAVFEYYEGCVDPGLTPPVMGNAKGDAMSSGYTVVETVPGPSTHVAVGDATLYMDFEWVRVGATIVLITDSQWVFTFPDPSDDDTSTTGAKASGVATLVPLLTVSNACPSGGGLDAELFGLTINPA